LLLFAVADDLVADIDTQIADLNGRAGGARNQQFDFFLAFTTEATA
jgi:hypothetical protein